MNMRKNVRPALIIAIGSSLVAGFLQWLEGDEISRIIHGGLASAVVGFTMMLFLQPHRNEPLTERAVLVIAGGLLFILFALVFVTNYPFP